MLRTPHRFAGPEAVEPGRTIEHDRVALLVDEVTRSASGYTFLCYPPHRIGSGRRVSVSVANGAGVKLLPNDHERRALADALVHKLGVMRLATGDTDHPATVWTLEPDVDWRNDWPEPPSEPASLTDEAITTRNVLAPGDFDAPEPDGE